MTGLRLFVALGIASVALTAGGAHTQAWLAKSVRVSVNFPPGGAADVIARAVAPG